MTRSKVSPDGRISDRDVAAKLVIIMVGLPARGKSYITKKLQRYLSWQQHNTRIFNVGNRRRIAARRMSEVTSPSANLPETVDGLDSTPVDATSPNDGGPPRIVVDEPTVLDLNASEPPPSEATPIDQSAQFFDPNNQAASQIREQLAIDTLDELLEYLLHQGGAVGILDATNSTIHRRQLLTRRIKEREPKLGILFIESICHDETVSRLY
jgi:6-phosphofructo-2-kinase